MLWSSIKRLVCCWETQERAPRLLRFVVLHKLNSCIKYETWQIILLVVEPVFLIHSVPIESVVVILTVPNKSQPVIPAHRDLVSSVVVTVFPVHARPVAQVLEPLAQTVGSNVLVPVGTVTPVSDGVVQGPVVVLVSAGVDAAS